MKEGRQTKESKKLYDKLCDDFTGFMEQQVFL